MEFFIIAITTSHEICCQLFTQKFHPVEWFFSQDFPHGFSHLKTAGSLHVSGASGAGAIGAALRWSFCGAAPWEARYCHRVALLDDMVIMTGGHGAQGDGMVSLVSQWFWMANCGFFFMVNSGLRMVNSGLMMVNGYEWWIIGCQNLWHYKIWRNKDPLAIYFECLDRY